MAGATYRWFGFTKSLALAYLISITGMAMLLIYPGENQILLSLFIMAGKFGISIAFPMVYVGNNEIFPMEAKVFAFGVCNFFCRSLTILSPLIAEMKPESIAKWTFICLCSMALICLNLLRAERSNN